MATVVRATRSVMVGTPSVRNPVTVRLGDLDQTLTGGGNDVPDAIRFQILYRFP